MLKNVECLGHSTIKIKENGKTIYVDPYNIKNQSNDADLIFITHGHYDHFSEQDIKLIKNSETIIVVTEDLYTNVLKLGFSAINIISVNPNRKYTVEGITFETIPAYNLNKQFHPKANDWTRI